MFYIIIFVILFILGWLDIINLELNSKKLFAYFLFLLFIILGSIRWETGTDWLNYHDYFRDNFNWSDFNDGRFEVGYAFINFVVKSFTSNYSVFLAVFAILTISIKGIAIVELKFNRYILITSLVFFSYFLADVFSSRQSLAISLTLLASRYAIHKPNFIRFLGIIIIASCFHITAILFIPAYFLKKKIISRRFLITTGLLCILFGFLLSMIPMIFYANFFAQFGGRVATKLMEYSASADVSIDTSGSAVDSKTRYIISVFKRLMILIPILIFYKRLTEDKVKTQILTLLFFGDLMFFLLTPVLDVLTRATAYYEMYEIFVLPMFLDLFKTRWKQVVVYIFITLFCLSKLMMVLYHFWDLYVPFQTIFEEPINRNLR